MISLSDCFNWWIYLCKYVIRSCVPEKHMEIVCTFFFIAYNFYDRMGENTRLKN